MTETTRYWTTQATHCADVALYVELEATYLASHEGPQGIFVCSPRTNITDLQGRPRAPFDEHYHLSTEHSANYQRGLSGTVHCISYPCRILLWKGGSKHNPPRSDFRKKTISFRVPFKFQICPAGYRCKLKVYKSQNFASQRHQLTSGPG